MKIRVCDICKEEKEIFFKCRIKHHVPCFENGCVCDDTMWFKAEICEDCLKAIKMLKMDENNEKNFETIIKERDAAIADLEEAKPCSACKKQEICPKGPWTDIAKCPFEWRGAQEGE